MTYYYRTYINPNVGFGASILSGISTRGDFWGVGISSDVDCRNLDVVGIGTIENFNVRGNAIISGVTTLGLSTLTSPSSNSQLSFELSSNTNLRIRVRGTDGIIRTANITLST